PSTAGPFPRTVPAHGRGQEHILLQTPPERVKGRFCPGRPRAAVCKVPAGAPGVPRAVGGPSVPSPPLHAQIPHWWVGTAREAFGIHRREKAICPGQVYLQEVPPGAPRVSGGPRGSGLVLKNIS